MSVESVNVAEGILRAGHAHPERTAIRVRGDVEPRDVSYADLERDVRRFASVLRERGIGEEQRILVALPDGPELIVAFLGAIWVGAVPVLVNPFLKPDDYRFFLGDARARLLIATRTLAEAPAVAGVGVATLSPEPPRAGSFWNAIDQAEAAGDALDRHADDPAFWLYSSGTTGRPKGTIHLQRNIPTVIESYGAHVLGITSRDVVYASSKLFFAYGLGASLYMPLAAGATVVLVGDPFQPERTWRVLDTERPTLFFSVPSAYRALLDHPFVRKREACEPMRHCLSAGEGLPSSVFEDWRAATAREILDGIGSTEMLHIYLSNFAGEARPGSLGRVVPGYDVEIVDESGRPTAPGDPGVMRVRGTSMALGYWRRLEASRRAFRGEWYDTGDQAVRDADGTYRIVGRADDMLKVSGQWVAPADVETVIARVGGVRECAVVGRADAAGLTELAVCVIAAVDADRGAVESAIEARCAAELPRYKRPRTIRWVEEFPRTATGKLQRFRLREIVAS